MFSMLKYPATIGVRTANRRLVDTFIIRKYTETWGEICIEKTHIPRPVYSSLLFLFNLPRRIVAVFSAKSFSIQQGKGLVGFRSSNASRARAFQILSYHLPRRSKNYVLLPSFSLLVQATCSVGTVSSLATFSQCKVISKRHLMLAKCLLDSKGACVLSIFESIPR